MFNFINERTSVRMASTLQTYSNDQRSTSCTHRERFISVSDILILSGPPELVSEEKNVLWPDEWTGDQKQNKKNRARCLSPSEISGYIGASVH